MEVYTKSTKGERNWEAQKGGQKNEAAIEKVGEGRKKKGGNWKLEARKKRRKKRVRGIE